MIETMTSVTAQIPSGFVVPTSAPVMAAASGIRPVAILGASTAAACAAPTYVVRDRHVAGDALVTGAFPGHTAWSPPTC